MLGRIAVMAKIAVGNGEVEVSLCDAALPAGHAVSGYGAFVRGDGFERPRLQCEDDAEVVVGPRDVLMVLDLQRQRVQETPGSFRAAQIAELVPDNALEIQPLELEAW